MLCQGQFSQTLSMGDISTHALCLCYKIQELPWEQDEKMPLYVIKSAQNFIFGCKTATESSGLHKKLHLFAQMF